MIKEIARPIIAALLLTFTTMSAFAALVPNAPITTPIDDSKCVFSVAMADKGFATAKDMPGVTVTDLGRFEKKNSVGGIDYFEIWYIAGGPNDGKYLVGHIDDHNCIDMQSIPVVTDEATINKVLLDVQNVSN